MEGPIPHLEARLCILLSIVPLAITHVLDSNSALYNSCTESLGSRSAGTGERITGVDHASKKQGLSLSLQILGQYPALLSPPASVISAANDAVCKAANVLTKAKNVKNGVKSDGCGNTFIKAGNYSARILFFFESTITSTRRKSYNLFTMHISRLALVLKCLFPFITVSRR